MLREVFSVQSAKHISSILNIVNGCPPKNSAFRILFVAGDDEESLKISILTANRLNAIVSPQLNNGVEIALFCHTIKNSEIFSDLFSNITLCQTLPHLNGNFKFIVNIDITHDFIDHFQELLSDNHSILIMFVHMLYFSQTIDYCLKVSHLKVIFSHPFHISDVGFIIMCSKPDSLDINHSDLRYCTTILHHYLTAEYHLLFPLMLPVPTSLSAHKLIISNNPSMYADIDSKSNNPSKYADIDSKADAFGYGKSMRVWTESTSADWLDYLLAVLRLSASSPSVAIDILPTIRQKVLYL